MTLNLERPLVVFDLETTGTNVNADRIVDICLVARMPDGSVDRWATLVNPGVPIPKAASDVHGITDEMVADAPRFADVAAEVVARLKGCDLGGFNVARFDLPLLQAELVRAGKPLDMGGVHVVDAMAIYHAREKRDLASAVRLYLGRAHDGAHRAQADAEATLQVLEAQVRHYKLAADVPALAVAGRSVEGIDADGKFVWDGAEAVLAFGKYKGKSLRMVARGDAGFLRWMLGATFAEDTKAVAREALAGRFPLRKESTRAA